MIRNLAGVKLDGSVPAAPQIPRVQLRQQVWWPLDLGGTLHVSIVTEAGVAVDMTGSKVRLTIRRNPEDIMPLVCRESALGSSDIVFLGTTFAAAKEATYRYDIVLIDAGVVWWQVVPTFWWTFLESVADPGDAPPIP